MFDFIWIKTMFIYDQRFPKQGTFDLVLSVFFFIVMAGGGNVEILDKNTAGTQSLGITKPAL